MRLSENGIEKLTAKLLLIQQEVDGVEKDAVAKTPKWEQHFASLNAVIDAVRPICLKHGVIIMQHTAENGYGEGSTGIGVVTLLAEAESGQFIEFEGEWAAVRDDPQKCGSALTYACRNLLQSLFLLKRLDDDGGEASGVDTKVSGKGKGKVDGGKKSDLPKPAAGSVDVFDD